MHLKLIVFVFLENELEILITHLVLKGVCKYLSNRMYPFYSKIISLRLAIAYSKCFIVVKLEAIGYLKKGQAL